MPFRIFPYFCKAHGILFFLVFLPGALFSQQGDPVAYVNPFIGTDISHAVTRWGSEGGTYPGAVAPFGFVQLTPETSVADKKGYYYHDSSIYFFSCRNHHSGYPNGSTGQLVVMPLLDTVHFRLREYKRPFDHKDETAEPGFYKVRFLDNGTVAEMTATVRSGMFRFTFPPGSTPTIFVGDMGEISMPGKEEVQGTRWNTLLRFSEPASMVRKVADGCLLSFPPSAKDSHVITLMVGGSGVSLENTRKNLTAELGSPSFDQLREQTRRRWRRELATVTIEDDGLENKIIFYTALYHSLLLPWIISDVDGKYQGRDGQIHQAAGENEYGGFSPWDTYRTVHPLLCLLYPARQKDMVLSMLDVFLQTGYLPVDPMTGNHAVPVIADSYAKGIRGFDSDLAYRAMKKSIDVPPFLQNDLEVYHNTGYVPLSYPESVTRTVEYAYDDWALARFALALNSEKEDAQRLMARSHSYSALFNPQKMFLLPRKGTDFMLNPGNFGYKEGDAWVYTYAAPHQSRELIDLLGGNEAFALRLDSALAHQQIVFDNETVLHVPYLFNAAARPQKTQQWVRQIMQTRYTNTPGGLPGNDDLGSMSAWYVFSALGIYPTAPGRPDYDVGSPIFRSATLHLANGKDFAIKSKNQGGGHIYVRSLTIDKKKYSKLTLPHALISSGGVLSVEMTGQPAEAFVPATDTAENTMPAFTVSGLSVSKKQVKPHELCWVRFSVANSGSVGTKTVKIFVNDKVYASKNILVSAGAQVKDSVSCRLYELGKTRVRMDDAAVIEVVVTDPGLSMEAQLQVADVVVLPLLKPGDTQHIRCTVQNTGWKTHTFQLPVYDGNSLMIADSVSLAPGATSVMEWKFQPRGVGFHKISIRGREALFKVYDKNSGSLVADLSLKNIRQGRVIDSSGFSNHGRVVQTRAAAAENTGYLKLGKDVFVEIPHSPSLDAGGQTITMMAWVNATEASGDMADLLTKGDHHVLQTEGSKLKFFAGGWGRGECIVDLPADWAGRPHHVAGVCDGRSLRVYIDGILRGTTALESSTDLSVSSQWNIGRNEEFPGQRIFEGYIYKVKIFAAPLSPDEIMALARDRH